jgi:hypothetical protein
MTNSAFRILTAPSELPSRHPLAGSVRLRAPLYGFAAKRPNDRCASLNIAMHHFKQPLGRPLMSIMAWQVIRGDDRAGHLICRWTDNASSIAK